MHDCAIAAWSAKGYYDYSRPVSAIRYMAEHGQTASSLPNYHPAGLPLIPGFIEMVDDADPEFSWRRPSGQSEGATLEGPDYIEVPLIDEAAGFPIMADRWWPYQRPSFVTPPFAGYVSGHSTYSRAAAELLELLTGSEYWPGGRGVDYSMSYFLVFEEGPSMTSTCSGPLSWMPPMKALSRMWGDSSTH